MASSRRRVNALVWSESPWMRILELRPQRFHRGCSDRFVVGRVHAAERKSGVAVMASRISGGTIDTLIGASLLETVETHLMASIAAY